jgi:hypothetical protein
MGGWREGISGVVGFVTLIFFAIALIDIYFEFRRWRPIGDRVRSWSGRYPLFSGGLIFLLGAMLAHFFLNKGW